MRFVAGLMLICAVMFGSTELPAASNDVARWGDGLEALLYAKGPLVLHALRRELGDEIFHRVLRSYLEEFRYQHIRTRDLIELTNHLTGRDYTNWFDGYVLGTDWPQP